MQDRRIAVQFGSQFARNANVYLMNSGLPSADSACFAFLPEISSARYYSQTFTVYIHPFLVITFVDFYNQEKYYSRVLILLCLFHLMR